MIHKIIYTILISDIVGLLLFMQLWLAKYEENKLEESLDRAKNIINSINNLAKGYRERWYKNDD